MKKGRSTNICYRGMMGDRECSPRSSCCNDIRTETIVYLTILQHSIWTLYVSVTWSSVCIYHTTLKSLKILFHQVFSSTNSVSSSSFSPFCTATATAAHFCHSVLQCNVCKWCSASMQLFKIWMEGERDVVVVAQSIFASVKQWPTGQ